HLDDAGAAPRRPEVDQHHLAAQRRQTHLAAGVVLEREVGRSDGDVAERGVDRRRLQRLAGGGLAGELAAARALHRVGQGAREQDDEDTGEEGGTAVCGDTHDRMDGRRLRLAHASPSRRRINIASSRRYLAMRLPSTTSTGTSQSYSARNAGSLSMSTTSS